jgi:hypothetical protein
MSKLLIIFAVLLTLAALLAVLDRILATAVASQISGRFAIAHDLRARPSVRVLGFPFLTQLAVGEYREIVMALGSLTAGGVELSELDARLTGVHASLVTILWPGRADITAENASATALVPFTVLSQRLPPGLMLSQVGPDIRISSTVLGVPVPGTLAVSVSAAGLTITPRFTGLPPLVGFLIPLGGLPLPLSVNSVSVTEQGLRLSASGRNIRLAAARGSGEPNGPR